MKKKIVFIDMDGVMADFDSAIERDIEDPPEMFVPGFFRNLPVMPGAREAITRLLAMEHLSCYVGSKPTTKNLYSATEKFQWISIHFPELLRRVVLVCDKSLLRGDYLIDDDRHRWGHKFQGEFIHFDREHPLISWQGVVAALETVNGTNPCPTE